MSSSDRPNTGNRFFQGEVISQFQCFGLGQVAEWCLDMNRPAHGLFDASFERPEECRCCVGERIAGQRAQLNASQASRISSEGCLSQQGKISTREIDGFIRTGDIGGGVFSIPSPRRRGFLGIRKMPDPQRVDASRKLLPQFREIAPDRRFLFVFPYETLTEIERYDVAVPFRGESDHDGGIQTPAEQSQNAGAGIGQREKVRAVRRRRVLTVS